MVGHQPSKYLFTKSQINIYRYLLLIRYYESAAVVMRLNDTHHISQDSDSRN